MLIILILILIVTMIVIVVVTAIVIIATRSFWSSATVRSPRSSSAQRALFYTSIIYPSYIVLYHSITCYVL